MQAISSRDRSVSHDTAVHGIPFMQPAVKREYVYPFVHGGKMPTPDRYDKTIKIIAPTHLLNPLVNKYGVTQQTKQKKKIGTINNQIIFIISLMFLTLIL